MSRPGSPPASRQTTATSECERSPRRRFGYVRRLKSGRWQASYVDRAGRRQRADGTFASKKAADKWLASVEVDLERGEWIDPALRRQTFADFVTWWLASTIHLAPTTKDNYESVLRVHLLPVLGPMWLGDITTVVVRDLLACIRELGRKPKTIVNVRNVLSAILSTAAAVGAIRVNPVLGIEVPRDGPTEMVFLEPEQILALAHAITYPEIRRGGGEHRRESYPQYGLAVELDATTGLRASELWALRRGRIHLGAGELEVLESVSESHGKLVYKPTKNYQRRRVPIIPSLRTKLAEHLAGLPDDPDTLVFTAPDGGPVRHVNYYARHFRPAVRAAGLPERTRFHDGRHTYAALLIAEGAHPRAVMERMGHSSITTTLNVYGHLFPRIHDELTNNLDATLREAESARAQMAPRAETMGKVISLRRRKR